MVGIWPSISLSQHPSCLALQSMSSTARAPAWFLAMFLNLLKCQEPSMLPMEDSLRFNTYFHMTQLPKWGKIALTGKIKNTTRGFAQYGSKYTHFHGQLNLNSEYFNYNIKNNITAWRNGEMVYDLNLGPSPKHSNHFHSVFFLIPVFLQSCIMV